MTVIDADVSTVSGAADKVLRVLSPPEWIMHLEFQAGPDTTLPRRTHCYNALLEDRHGLPVRSVLVLLRPESNLSNLTGLYQRQFPDEPPYLTIHYQVVRVWQLPVETLLAGGLGTLPLAPISAVAQADLPRVIERIKKRLRRRSRAEAGSLWTATYVLMGLRYEQALINQLLQEVIAMEESVTYQAIVAKGERQGALREARRTILLLGRERFGAAGTSVTSAIEAIDDLERLEQLSIRLLQAESWKELLPAPQPTSRQAKQVPRKNDRRGKKPT